MSIIGITAVFILLSLNQSTNNEEIVAKVKDFYQNLSDAFSKVEAKYGPLSGWYVREGDAMGAGKVGERLLEFLEVSKKCGVSNTGRCSSSIFNNGGYVFITADGTHVEMYDGDIYVDLDGVNKGANSWGKDRFRFQFYNGTKYEITPKEQLSYKLDATSYISDCTDCTAWVIMNENKDYLKCRSSLSATNTTCK